MAGDDERWTRADLARWFLDHDEVDEAARVLEPGDELALGRSDYLNLAAALSRRGLSARYELRRVSVLAPDVAQEGGRGNLAGSLAASSRKPPARAPAILPTADKKTA